MKSLPAALFLLAGLLAGNVHAADATVVDITPGFSFVEYGGSPAVGQGAVDADSTLFYIDEKAVAGWKSWYFFFDPRHVQGVEATIRFDRPIHAVLTTQTDLDATNAVYGIEIGGAAVLDAYGTSRFMGLEGRDALTWSPGGQELRIDWSAADPGDHIRVLVAVPEPSSPLLIAAGLAGLGLLLRRRRSRG